MRDLYQKHKKVISLWALSFMLFITGMIYFALLSSLHEAWSNNDQALTMLRKEISDRGSQKVAYQYCGSVQTKSGIGLFLPWELQKLVKETSSKVELCRDIVVELDRHS